MIGRTIDRYEINGKLGEGGMGSVWEATDTRLKRAVALKFLPGTLVSDPDARRRFLREARAASILNHPGIATVYDAGEADGLVYIAFQKIEGERLSDCIARGPLPFRKAADIARQIAGALAHAHARGILHRDVTANNIMLTPSGNAVLIDFGLARSGDDSSITRAEAIIGTPAYVAPEIWRGQKAGPESDIYGLGVVLYEMVTGRRPFQADRPEALMFSVLHDDPEPPGRIRAGVPHELERVILKALERELKDRFESAQAMSRALEEVEELVFHPETSAPAMPATPVTPVLPGRRSPRRKPRDLITRSGPPGRELALERLVLAAIIILAIGFGIRRLPVFRTSPTFSSVVVLPFQNLSESPEDSQPIAEAVGRELATKLALNDLRVIPWETSSRYTEEHREFKKIAADLKVQAIVTGTFQWTGSRYQIDLAMIDGKSGLQTWAREFDDASIFSIQTDLGVRVAQKLKGRLNPGEKQGLSRTPTSDNQAFEFYARAAHELAAGSPETALGLFQQAAQLDPKFTNAYVGIGAIHLIRHYVGTGGMLDVAEAEFNFRQALRLDPGSVVARKGLVRTLVREGNIEGAVKLTRQALPGVRPSVERLSLLGETYLYCGLPDLAVSEFRKVIDLDPENVEAHWFLIPMLSWSGQHEDAVSAGENYLSKFGPDPEILTWIGVSNHCLGHLETARQYYERAMENVGNEPNLPMRIYAANLYTELGDQNRAHEILEETRRSLERLLDSTPDNNHMRTVLAATYVYLREPRLAAQQEKILFDAPAPQIDLFQYSELALAHAGIGDVRRAFELLRLMNHYGISTAYLENIYRVLGAPAFSSAPEHAAYKREALQVAARQKIALSSPLDDESAAPEP